jgi:hypothetical protein
VFASLHRFIADPTPSYGQALQALRLLFMLMFMGQLAVVAVTAASFLLFVQRSAGASPLIAQILLAFAVLQLPVALGIATLAARQGLKGGALAAVISLAVILASPAWYALLLWLISSPGQYLLLALLVLTLAYSLGFIQSSYYAKMAIRSPQQQGD